MRPYLTVAGVLLFCLSVVAVAGLPTRSRPGLDMPERTLARKLLELPVNSVVEFVGRNGRPRIAMICAKREVPGRLSYADEQRILLSLVVRDQGQERSLSCAFRSGEKLALELVQAYSMVDITLR